MKKVFAMMMLFLFLCASFAYADPRMETTDNFCHWIHNTINSDDETFVADCGSQISVLQEEGAGIAQGFARVVRSEVPVDFDEVTTALSIMEKPKDEEEKGEAANVAKKPHPLKQSLVITSEDFPGQACVMVDSNETQYNSNQWVNTITLQLKHRWAEVGTLTYILRCIDGAEN